jgi:DNA mismatch endonuclease, patch repair protein
LPYPEPTSAGASAVMRANRNADTRPELALRSALHRVGLRFRVGMPIVASATRVRADIVFTSARVAIFVDGCFWHRCPEHGVSPTANASYWGPKLRGNVERDRRVDGALAVDGWRVVRVWEHQVTVDAVEVARRIAEQVSASKAAPLRSHERAGAPAPIPASPGQRTGGDGGPPYVRLRAT